MEKKKVANGIFWVEIPEADLRILCGCPADSVKHLMKAGLIAPTRRGNVEFETGPNAILLSDTSVQKGSFANLAEFPLLQMFYRQGMLIPGHPGNTGRKPLLIGLGDQVRSQSAYFFRGIYGLGSEKEIEASGVPPAAAREMFRVKKWFAFDRIHPTEELVDTRALDAEAITLSPGVVVHRKGFNRYEFIAQGSSVEVDLSLGVDEEFEPVYTLPPGGVRREPFSIIHIGEGDGWDVTRPCMGSIVCCRGLLYLVDAGPHITRSLEALGLGADDIEGVFHTHAHDDHFAGLTSLVRAERRILYYAVPSVRASVQKKLAALMHIDEERFSRYFEVRDLRRDEWNEVGGMEVKPVYSPHPVETTVFLFRSGAGKSRKTYAHLADISSEEVLGKLAAADNGTAALSAQTRGRFERAMLMDVDVKKTDVGGGLIHGNAMDFAGDHSRKLILSHGIAKIPDALAGVAQTASFGDNDVLIPGGAREHLLRTARSFLAGRFPGVPSAEIEALVTSPTRDFPPGATLQGPSPDAPGMFLVLNGAVEETDPITWTTRKCFTGALLGEPVRHGDELRAPIVRAASAVTVMPIPRETYRAFALREGPADARRRSLAHRAFLSLCPLFTEIRSENVLNCIAAAMQNRCLPKGRSAPSGAIPELLLLGDGEVDLMMGAQLIECIGAGGFWGEERIVSTDAALFEARAATECTYYAVPAGALSRIPLVQWELQESFEKRLRSFRAGFRFEWTDSFSVGVALLDEQHRTLFRLAHELSERIRFAASIEGHGEAKVELAARTREHFTNEEALMESCGYPRLSVQRKAHADMLSMLDRFLNAKERRERPRSSTTVDYLKDWLVRHTLLEDLQYRAFFAGRGIQ